MFTIVNNSTSKIQIKNSIFICNLVKLEKIEQVRNILNKILNEYKQATHNCYAYRIGNTNILEYSSDDGEPKGSAGKPILNTLRKNNLTNVISIVTRYFGGIKLGIRGLIDAYSQVTENTIKISQLTEVFERRCFIIECKYNVFDFIKNKISKYDVLVEDINYSSIVNFKICINKKDSSFLEDFLNRERINYSEIES
ncbi:MAG: YigZ family protein [Candidatus Sericytochromatia bacterium]|nr:MAG: YigZ family protein [Candidatus Sericytochromatia bacterium]